MGEIDEGLSGQARVGVPIVFGGKFPSEVGDRRAGILAPISGFEIDPVILMKIFSNGGGPVEDQAGREAPTVFRQINGPRPSRRGPETRSDIRTTAARCEMSM